MPTANKVGFVDLSTRVKITNNDETVSDIYTLAIAKDLRRLGHTIDCRHKIAIKKGSVGLRQLGKFDFLKQKGFAIQ